MALPAQADELCTWPATNVGFCRWAVNPLQSDADQDGDAGSDRSSAFTVAPGFYDASIMAPTDTTDVFVFHGEAGQQFNGRYDGAISIRLETPSGNTFPAGYFSWDGLLPESGQYAFVATGGVPSYEYYFCFTVDSVGSPFC